MHIHGRSDVDMHSLVRTYFACHEVEGSYRKCLAETADKDKMKPRFYNLAPADYSNQDVPRIDGLVSMIHITKTHH